MYYENGECTIRRFLFEIEYVAVYNFCFIGIELFTLI